ncbi:class I SAM-dependent methyltransferase [Solidesulfovibrio sp. C21]|uniref:class I SAM-dependent methyltransferase n=1 Tax=Solidesulfovibrio sp. C21 TaxID=3398613 RepID=UPI0039FCFC1D
MHIYRCNCCNNSSFKQIGQLYGRSLVVCCSCGLRSFYPVPTYAELAALNSDGGIPFKSYFKLNKNNNSTHYKRILQYFELLKNRYRPGNRVLEVGPGSGDFIELCLEKKIEIEALEISKTLAESLRNRYSVIVNERPLEQASLPPDSFFAIVAFDIIEHVNNPRAWLQAAWSALRPGGTLVFSTVSTKNLLNIIGLFLNRFGFPGALKRLHPAYHIYYFTPNVLEKYLRETNFIIETIRQDNYDVNKATQNNFMRFAMKCIYKIHATLGEGTNIYITCQKPPTMAVPGDPFDSSVGK